MIPKDELKKLEKRIAFEIEKEAKLLCPVDTGRLRASIQTFEVGFDTYVGTPVEYASFVEFGTSKPSYPKQPFLRPAVDKIKAKYGG